MTDKKRKMILPGIPILILLGGTSLHADECRDADVDLNDFALFQESMQGRR